MNHLIKTKGSSICLFRFGLRGFVGLLLALSSLYAPGFALGVLGHKRLGILFYFGTWFIWWITVLCFSKTNACILYKASVLLLVTAWLAGMLTTLCSFIKRSGRRLTVPGYIILFAFFILAYILNFGFIKNIGKWHGITIGMSDGQSMSPFIPQGDILIARKVHDSQIARGDVVIAHLPPASEKSSAPSIIIIKRITGMAGDVVRLEPDTKRVYLDVKTTSRPVDGYIIPEGRVFLQGDNSEHSMDSRDFGDIPFSTIAGRVLFSIRTWHCFNFSTTSSPD